MMYHKDLKGNYIALRFCRNSHSNIKRYCQVKSEFCRGAGNAQLQRGKQYVMEVAVESSWLLLEIKVRPRGSQNFLANI